MRAHDLCHLMFALLGLHDSVVVGDLDPYGQPFDHGIGGRGPYRKRQPSIPQEQSDISVPVPGQQTQNINTTVGTEDTPGMITNSPATNDEVDCRNIQTGRDNKCWDELDLTKFVEDWVIKNSCHTDEPFASCFLRKEGFPGLDCTGVKISSCTAPQGDDLSKDPEVFYVAYNIYGKYYSFKLLPSAFFSDRANKVAAVNQFFLSWWTAVGDAASVAADNVGAIVQLLDPITDTNAQLDDILITLTGIFALVPGASYFTSSAKGITDGWTAFAQTVENALFVIPQIGRWIFPVDTITSQVIQMSALSSNMAGIIQMVQNNLNKTLVSAMANTAEFLAFASQGNFSASAPSLPNQANYLLYAFNTYIISQALNGNNIYGTIGVDSNPQALATNGSTTAYDLSDCKGYNQQNVCDAWWYSGRYSSAFGLDDLSHSTRNYGDVLTALLSNYTTGELLFDGAYACNANGNYGQPVNVTVSSAGVSTGCLSQLRIVTWDMSCTNPTWHSDPGCEFLEVPRQGDFFGNCGSHSYFSVMDDPEYCVPASYLGPLIAQDGIKLKRT